MEYAAENSTTWGEEDETQTAFVGCPCSAAVRLRRLSACSASAAGESGQHRRRVVFDNFTDDYAISHEVEQELVKTLSGYYRVLPPAEVEWALVRLGLLRGQSPDPNQAIRLGQMLGVDALVMGEVSGYFQPVTQTPPYPTGREMIDERATSSTSMNMWKTPR